ncbi:Brp/Blh family beta-carotene 15,15'-dioxygenase [Flavobacterium sp.]
MIFTFGILHGANDLELIERIEHNKQFSFLKILLAYIILVVVSVVLFYKIPLLALLIFILVSAFHFGEQHWQDVLKGCNKIISGLFQFNYGILILTALFYFNSPEVKDIIYKIAHVTIAENYFFYFLIATFSFYIFLSFIIIKNSATFKFKILEQTFYIFILCLIFKVASLLLGFAIYFIFWHSIPSLHDQIKFLYGSYTFANFKKYFKSAFVYWIISLIGVFILYTLSKDMVIFDALFFSFLASITFPHFIIILKMYKN